METEPDQTEIQIKTNNQVDMDTIEEQTVETAEEITEVEATEMESREVEVGEDQEINEMISHTLEGEPTYFIVNSDAGTNKEGMHIELIGEPIPISEIEGSRESFTPLERLTCGLKQENSSMQIVIEPSNDGGAPTARLVNIQPSSISDKPVGTKIKVLSKPTTSAKNSIPVEPDDLMTLAGINTSEVSIQWKPTGSSNDQPAASKPPVNSTTSEQPENSMPDVEIKWRPIQTYSKRLNNDTNWQEGKTKDEIDKLQLLKDLHSSDESIDLDSDLDDLGSLSDADDSFSDMEQEIQFKKEIITDDEEEAQIDKASLEAKLKKELNIKRFFKKEITNKTLLDIGKKADSGVEYGKPYVVLASAAGDPITCYVARQPGSKEPQYIATSNQTLPPQVILNSLTPNYDSSPTPLTNNNPIRKDLEQKLIEMKRELEETKALLKYEQKQNKAIDALKEKIVNKNKKLKTIFTQRMRLNKSLQEYKSELANTQKALQIVESKAVLWNDTILSDLGKLIFKLHAGKNKRILFDQKTMSSKMPPEVKGFVISLFMTSQKAYQLVRNCFNGLPPASTVTKWIHGERVEDGTPKPKKPRVVTSSNEVILDESFGRVIKNRDSSGPIIVQYEPRNDTEHEQNVEMETQETSDHVVIETFNEEGQNSHQEEVNNEQVITCENVDEEGVEMITPEPGTIYYILDEKGNVTGQLSEPPPDVIYTSEFVGTVEGYHVAEEGEPQHEIVIG